MNGSSAPRVDSGISVNRNALAAAAAAAVLLVLGGYLYYRWRKPAVSPTLGSDIFEQVQNPLKDELPQTNPFKAETNPFKNTETNPFIKSYENPFK